jgi:fatty-acyl-CoA synthase
MSLLSAGTLQHVPSQTFTVADRVEQKAAEIPDRVFLHYGDRTLDYAGLNAAANRVAHLMHEQGVLRGDVVALMMENRPEFPISWMGLAKLGVTTALLNSNVTGRPLEHAFQATGARHLVVGAECLERLAGLGPEAPGRPRVWVYPDPEISPAPLLPPAAEDLAPHLDAASSENPDAAWRAGLVAGDDLFHIFTSGTTGLPKAARLSHMRWLGVGDGFSGVCGYGPDDVLYCVLPLYHGAAGMVVVSCTLAQGARFVLRRKFSASAFWDDVRRFGITGCQYIGEICRYLLNQPPTERDRDHTLRVMTGAGLGVDIWEEFQARFGVEHIFEGWSSTEANTSLLNLDNVPGSCGRMPFKELHNGRLVRFDVETEAHPRNADGFFVECEVGEVGEFIGAIPDLPDSGAGRFEGYTSKEATENKILRDVFQPGDAWYRSGDLLRHDEEGYFYFVDRIGDTYRWKSENVSTQEVAEELSGFPGLDMGNVYGVRVPKHEGRAGMAALLLRDRDAFDGSAFFEWVDARLPRYAQPLFVRLVAEPDLTTTFRLRKVDLRRDGYDPRATSDPLFVRDENAKSYLPLSDEVLDRTGLLPFVHDPD